MSWIQVLTISFSIFGMFFYLANKIDRLQKSIYEEMKDFHSRLCAREIDKK